MLMRRQLDSLPYPPPNPDSSTRPNHCCPITCILDQELQQRHAGHVDVLPCARAPAGSGTVHHAHDRTISKRQAQALTAKEDRKNPTRQSPSTTTIGWDLRQEALSVASAAKKGITHGSLELALAGRSLLASYRGT